MTVILDALVADFNAQKTVIQSILTLLTTLFADYNKALADLAAAVAAGDPVAQKAAQDVVDELDVQVKAQTQTLQSALIANAV